MAKPIGQQIAEADPGFVPAVVGDTGGVGGITEADFLSVVGMQAYLDSLMADYAPPDAQMELGEHIVGYERVTGADPCMLCLLASCERYFVEDLLPIHDNCECDVAPIYGTEDPGRVIHQDLLDELHAKMADMAETSAEFPNSLITTAQDGKAYIDRLLVHEPYAALTENERGAVASYQGIGSGSMNGALRRSAGDEAALAMNTDSAVLRNIDNLDKAFQDARPLNEPVVSWRGLSRDVIADLRTGDEFVDYGFISTSLDPELAYGWGNATVEILNRAGDEALWVEAVTDRNLGERELLLPRGTKFRVLGWFDEPRTAGVYEGQTFKVLRLERIE